jgi:hypothetical protein
MLVTLFLLFTGQHGHSARGDFWPSSVHSQVQVSLLITYVIFYREIIL